MRDLTSKILVGTKHTFFKRQRIKILALNAPRDFHCPASLYLQGLQRCSKENR
ncbi:MAG TPA: hypothetical protein PL133_10915 [Methylophilaceae bacterium]|nr:hypothetical protein [Methylophilaceae bacterium]